jgi:hypothetical protein
MTTTIAIYYTLIPLNKKYTVAAKTRFASSTGLRTITVNVPAAPVNMSILRAAKMADALNTAYAEPDTIKAAGLARLAFSM